MHYQPYPRPKWISRKQFTIFSPLLVCRAARPWCSAIAAGGRSQKPEGSRCSEMHSQPYLSPKWVIPDENPSYFEKTIYLFHPFLVCRPVCLWHNAIAAGGLGAAQGPQKLEGSRCSEMHSQPYLRSFFLVCRAVWLYTAPWISNGQCLRADLKFGTSKSWKLEYAAR